MKIVNREEFLKMPIGTVFSCSGSMDSSVFEAIEVFGGPIGDPAIDYSYENFTMVDGWDSGEMHRMETEMQDTGCSYPMKTGLFRDGSFEEAWYMIFERNDLLIMKDKIEKAIEIVK